MPKLIQELGTEAVFDTETMRILTVADARPILDDKTKNAAATTSARRREPTQQRNVADAADTSPLLC
jgi:hypothetical protein